MKASDLMSFHMGGQKNYNIYPKEESTKAIKNSANNVNNINVNIVEKSRDELPKIKNDEVVEVMPEIINVKYPLDESFQPITTDTAEIIDLRNQMNYMSNIIKSYEIINDIFLNNPLYINKYIVASQENLKILVELLTGLKCVLQLEEDIAFCGRRTKYDEIDKILIKNHDGNVIGDLKHEFNGVYTFITSKKISLKYCH